MSDPILEPHEIQQAIRDLQKQVLYLEERIQDLEEELEALKPEEDFSTDFDDEEENVEPVS